MPLKGEGDKAPKIRNARPLTAMRYEGTRKRRRAAIGDYTWSVGDRVDAWIADRYMSNSKLIVCYCDKLKINLKSKCGR